MSEWKETDIGALPKTWDLRTVDEIKNPDKKSIISGPFGSNISAKYFVGTGVPVIRGNNLSLSVSEKFKDDGFVYITDEKAEKLRTWATIDDIIFTAVGTIGQVGLITKGLKYSDYIISNKQLRLRVDTSQVLPIFAYFWFSSPFMVEQIIQRNTGSSVPLINLSVLKSLLIPIPPLEEQRAIAAVLSSLDDKIDLLHRQNQTLEQMAEALYDAWFEESDFTSRVSDLIDLQNGYAFKSKSFQDFGEDRVLKIKNISGGIVDIETTDFVSHETVENLDEKFSISTGDILFAMTGAKIGKMGIIPKTDYKLWLNQRVGLFKEKYYGSRFLAYLHLKSDYGKDYIENTATGSAQPNISGTGIESCEFPEISEREIIDYSNQLAPLYEKVIFNLGQIRTLTALRDTLLPKLMSGEVSLSNFGEVQVNQNNL